MKIDWQSHASPEDRDRHLADVMGGLYLGDPGRPPIPGGRREALDRLRSYDPADYGQSRNHLSGAVSRLSAYLRHGMVTVTEVREHLRANYPASQVEELLRQLAWRDFFDKVLDHHGAGILEDIEEPKHAVPRVDFLPEDVARGETGLPCIDGMLAELFAEGYLHNHERLWFAAYLCHFRGVWWGHGARLFRQYLLDGDMASNTASWQWVESTFAHKPYFMNKWNIDKFSAGRWCRRCRVRCPFDAGYEQLEDDLFRSGDAPLIELTLKNKPGEAG